jgi:Family of unknown function (DUF5908)
MPVIINEIQITAFVSEQSNPANTQVLQSANAGVGLSEQEKEQTIKTCVEEVLRIIKEKKER